MRLNKIFAVSIFFLAYPYCLKAQEQVIAKVFYKFSHVRDTALLDYVYTENMILLLGKTSSEYKSYDRMVHDSIFMANPNNLNDRGSTKSGSGSGLLLFASTGVALETETIINKYVFPIDYPKIEWKIISDTLSINGLSCQKAIGAWKGRTYEVWFCPDLPFRVGPWKLGGLPGLILKAHDVKNQVMFEFAGFQNYVGALKVEPPAAAIKTTRASYQKLREAFLENPTSFIKSSMPQIKDIKVSAPYVRKPPINNPLELEK